jgi:hypothetical protein
VCEEKSLWKRERKNHGKNRLAWMQRMKGSENIIFAISSHSHSRFSAQSFDGVRVT